MSCKRSERGRKEGRRGEGRGEGALLLLPRAKEKKGPIERGERAEASQSVGRRRTGSKTREEIFIQRKGRRKKPYGNNHSPVKPNSFHSPLVRKIVSRLAPPIGPQRKENVVGTANKWLGHQQERERGGGRGGRRSLLIDYESSSSSVLYQRWTRKTLEVKLYRGAHGRVGVDPRHGVGGETAVIGKK